MAADSDRQRRASLLKILAAATCAVLLLSPALVYLVMEFRQYEQLRKQSDDIRGELLRVGCWKFVVPSFAEDYNFTTCDKDTLQAITTEFLPISSWIETEDYRTGCGGCSISVSSPDSNMSLLVADGWGMAIWSASGEAPTAIHFTFPDESLFKLCSTVAGFGYPLDPLVPRDLRSQQKNSE